MVVYRNNCAHLSALFKELRMSVARPVSLETLASIPWMSAKSLSHTMREVSIRGPHDADTWRHLVSRADVIAGSMNAKQTALVLNSLARIESRDVADCEAFLKRFVKRFLPRTLTDMNSLDIAQVVHALAHFPPEFTDDDVRTALVGTIRTRVDGMDPRSLSMTALGVARMQLCDIADVLLHRALELRESLEDQAIAQMFSLAASCGHAGVRECARELSISVAQRLPSISVRSLSVIVNSLSRLKVESQELVDLVAAEILENGNTRFTNATAVKPLVVLLRSLQKMGLMERIPLACHKLADLISSDSSYHSADTETLSILLSALSWMKGYCGRIDHVFEILAQRELSAAQLTLAFQVMARSGRISQLHRFGSQIDLNTLVFTGQQLSIIAAACECLHDTHTRAILASVSIRAQALENEGKITRSDMRSIQTILERLV